MRRRMRRRMGMGWFVVILLVVMELTGARARFHLTRDSDESDPADGFRRQVRQCAGIPVC